MTVDALTEAQTARSELRASDAWKRWGGDPATHVFKCGQHLDACIAALQPTPAPTPSAVTKPFGVLRLGNDYSHGTGYDRYGMVCVGVGDADACAALPGKSLVYMDYFESPTWFAGIPRTAAGPYTMLLEQGDYAGQPLFDPAAPGLADALIKNIGDFLRAHKLDGFYTDNCGASLAPFSIDHAQLPAKYQTVSNWYDAVQSLVVKVGAALKQQGFYVGANILAWFPGDAGVFPGTHSDDGTATIEWIKRCAPGLSWVMVENWMQKNGHLRSAAVQWDDWWDKWQALVRPTQDLGLDFVGTCDLAVGGQAAAVYTQASFLLDKDDGRAGGVMVNGSLIEVYSSGWTKSVGAAKGPKAKVGNAWVRKFDDGAGGTVTVTVDPVAVTASIV